MKTLREKEILLVTSNFSFSQSVFYPFGEHSAIFIKFKIVVCKLFQFGKSRILSFGKGLRKAPIANLHTHKDLLHLLYPFFIRHILKPQYKNKNFTFTLCYEAITTRYLKPSYIVLNIKWHGDFTNIRPLAEHIFNQIEDMEDVDFIEPMQNIRLVILSQQEQLTKQFLNTPIPKEENANKTKHSKAESVPFVSLIPRMFYFVIVDICAFVPIVSKISDN